MNQNRGTAGRSKDANMVHPFGPSNCNKAMQQTLHHSHDSGQKAQRCVLVGVLQGQVHMHSARDELLPGVLAEFGHLLTPSRLWQEMAKSCFRMVFHGIPPGNTLQDVYTRAGTGTHETGPHES